MSAAIPASAAAKTTTNVYEALNGEHKEEYRKACLKELDKWKERGVMTPVDASTVPSGALVFRSQWVLREKHLPDGTVQYKARLVACGNQEDPNSNILKASPVCTPDAQRAVLAVIANDDFEYCGTADVTSAYTHVPVKEEQVFMKQPPMFDDGTGRVWSMNRYVYGLYDAARRWFEHASATLIAAHYKQSLTDQCVFVKCVGNNTIIITLHVDDMLIAAKTKQLFDEFTEHMSANYEIKIKPCVDQLLGITIHIDKATSTVTLGQQEYVEKMLAEFGFSDASPVDTQALPPRQPSIKEGKNVESEVDAADDKPVDVKFLQRMSGSLRWLADHTRPDIKTALNIACRNIASHPAKAEKELKRILRYVKRTKDYGQVFKRTKEGIILTCFVDSDWASDPEDRVSVAGIAAFIGSSNVASESNKQDCIALSSAEAEYVAYCHALKIVMFHRQLLAELGYPQQTTTIYTDSASAKALAENPVVHKRTKHIDIRYHSIREHVKKGNIRFQYVRSADQIADLFTKPLPAASFFKHRASLVAPLPATSLAQ